MGYTIANASWQEITNGILGLAGFACNCWCLYDAYLDLLKARRRNGELRLADRAILRIAAVGNVRAEIVRLHVQAFFLFVTLVMLRTPPAVSSTALALGIRYGLMASICMLALNSVWNVRDRRAIREWIHQSLNRRANGTPDHV